MDSKSWLAALCVIAARVARKMRARFRLIAFNMVAPGGTFACKSAEHRALKDLYNEATERRAQRLMMDMIPIIK